MPRPPVRPIGVALPGVPAFAVAPLEGKIRIQLEAEYKKLLNLPTLPAEIKSGIDAASKIAAQRATQRNLELQAAKAARTFYQPVKVDQLIADKLGQAKAGVKVVSQSADLGEILLENAKMLRKKWQALKDAGFTEDESFQLIKAEVEGKAARRGNV